MSKCYQCKIIKEKKEFYYNNNKYYKICLQCRRLLYCEHKSNKWTDKDEKLWEKLIHGCRQTTKI